MYLMFSPLMFFSFGVCICVCAQLASTEASLIFKKPSGVMSMDLKSKACSGGSSEKQHSGGAEVLVCTP